MPIAIHGKQYVTVAERVASLHEEFDAGPVSIFTGIHSEDETQVTFWATVTTPAGTFWGHARSSKTDRSIEGQSPLEVAETSAVGRALGFAGYGVVDGIATADEVQKVAPPTPRAQARPPATFRNDTPAAAVLRKLYATAKDKGMGEAELKMFLQTDSLKALAQHMMRARGDCDMGHPHDVVDEAAGYRVMLRWLESGEHGMIALDAGG